MEIETIQRELTRLGLYSGKIDGLAGKLTRRGIDKAVAPYSDDSWSDARKQIAFEQLVYEKAGIDTGKIDGLVGEQTRYARRVWSNGVEATWRDSSFLPVTTEPRTVIWPTQKNAATFYGPPGTGHTLLVLPCPFRIAWEPAKTVSRVTVHSKCLPAFKAIWFGAHEHYGFERLKELRLDMFGGCFNDRNIRGGSVKSMHAYACAWDVDPDRNQLRWGRDLALLDDLVYKPFWDLVFAQGGISLGHELNYDWMHFQLARLR